MLKIRFSAHSEDLKPRSPALNEVMMMVDDEPNTTGWVGGVHACPYIDLKTEKATGLGQKSCSDEMLNHFTLDSSVIGEI